MSRSKHRILVVDDEPANLQLLRYVLEDKYRLTFATDGAKALQLARLQHPDLILMDIMMPVMNGYDTVRALKADPATRHIPVIFVTAMSEVADEAMGFEIGAVDYLTKPVSPPIVLARVRTHLALVGVEELNATRLQIIQRLGRAAEYRDNETGLHVIRMSHYAQVLGRATGMDEEDAEQLLNAAPMHDVGKIGIPDHILLKPGKLDEQEWAVMRRHPYIGYKIIGEQDSPLLSLAAEIAYTHHEKWDGSGYPRRLQGEDIPLAGRIVALADVFDALTTARPYKPAWPVEQAVAYIRSASGQHFDPDLVPLFLDRLPELLDIRERWLEEPAAAR
ncbi:response regulator [Macromonas nakdongensis]|uniref:response regulator n=1 Tax=Macromonas nakdongensis TaxID=1843082 RepID=UPI000C32D1DD|nr:two-component system response regulator [Macromonas nakdongensis]